MSRSNAPFLSGAPRPRKSQGGQMFLTMALMLPMLIAFAGFVVDLGYVYVCYQELQASADAAAIAAGSVLPNWTLAQQYATLYSATPGNKNVVPGLLNVTMTVSNACSPTLAAAPFEMVCPTADTTQNEQIVHANAIQVVENASVPTLFAKIFGVSTVPITVTASARARGGVPHPLNVVLVVDTTPSTQNGDNNCPNTGIANPSELDCEKAGVRTLLLQLKPSVDAVGLMTFPGLTTDANIQGLELGCQQSIIIGCAQGDQCNYSSPNLNYSIVGFSNDFRVSDTSTVLNGGGSNLVKAVDWDDGNSCQEISNYYGLQRGAAGTYYAGAITAAQTALNKLSATQTPPAQNVIILLSDGDAPGQGCANPLGGCWANPPIVNQCSDAITAAAQAARQGTWVYSIAYGASTAPSNGQGTAGTCDTDPAGTNACGTMQSIAYSYSPLIGAYPDPSKFYSDGQGQNGCVSAVNPSITTLNQIFQAIGNDLQTAALISNTTY